MQGQKKPVTSIDDYIAGFSEEIQDLLRAIRKGVSESAPDAREAISYQMPTFKLNGILVHFAAFKNHIGFYPTPSGITAFQEELSPYKTSKGAIQFPLDQPLPLELIRKIVQFRVRENLGKNSRTKKAR